MCLLLFQKVAVFICGTSEALIAVIISGPVFAFDWHPEVSWLATASGDKTIKVE
jgi:hypothetical protein